MLVFVHNQKVERHQRAQYQRAVRTRGIGLFPVQPQGHGADTAGEIDGAGDVHKAEGRLGKLVERAENGQEGGEDDDDGSGPVDLALARQPAPSAVRLALAARLGEHGLDRRDHVADDDAAPG